MPTERMEAETAKAPLQLILASLLVLAGVSAIVTTLVLWVVLADEAGGYYAYGKALRDSAVAGSEILDTQSTLEAYPKWLMSLPFVGMALIFLGIAALFEAVISKLRLHGTVLATVLPAFHAREAD